MGIFSKLFSREGGEPGESQDDGTQPATGEGADGAATSEAAVASTADSRAKGSSNEPAVKPTAAASPNKADARARRDPPVPAPPGAAQANQAAPPPAASAKASPAKPTAAIKREVPVGAKPPPALGAAAPAQPASTPQAPADTKGDTPDEAAKSPANAASARNQPVPGRKHAPAQARARTQPLPMITEMVVKNHRPQSPLPAPAAAGNETRPQAAADASTLDAALDAAMAALLEPGATGPSGADDHAADQRAVSETFSDMAKVHAHPLRELMFQLSVGRTPRHWAEACRPVLRPLLDAATQIELIELVGALGALDAALERAAAEATPCIGDAAAEMLTSAYARLRQQMPDAFALPEQADTRRLILLESLLLQIPSMQRRTLLKLYAAGLSSLVQLGQARADELCAVAGVDGELAREIVERVRRFEQEQGRLQPTTQRSQVEPRLRAILSRLSEHQAEFERADDEDDAARKRVARRAREATVLELDLLFAQLGDLGLIQELKRFPVRAKIQRVTNYLDELQASA